MRLLQVGHSRRQGAGADLRLFSSTVFASTRALVLSNLLIFSTSPCAADTPLSSAAMGLRRWPAAS